MMGQNFIRNQNKMVQLFNIDPQIDFLMAKKALRGIDDEITKLESKLAERKIAHEQLQHYISYHVTRKIP